jgi:hypothetical protein
LPGTSATDLPETSVLFISPVVKPAASPSTERLIEHPKVRWGSSLLATAAGVLAAFGSFVVLAVVTGAAWLAIVGIPLDLAPRDWQRLATMMALGAAVVSLLAYLFGGYVAARLGGHDGLQQGLRVFALAVLALGLLGMLLLGMAGPLSVGTGLRQPSMAATPGQGISFGDVATKAAIWSLIAMLLGSLAGGLLGGRVHRRRAEAAQAQAAAATEAARADAGDPAGAARRAASGASKRRLDGVAQRRVAASRTPKPAVPTTGQVTESGPLHRLVLLLLGGPRRRIAGCARPGRWRG